MVNVRGAEEQWHLLEKIGGPHSKDEREKRHLEWQMIMPLTASGKKLMSVSG